MSLLTRTNHRLENLHIAGTAAQITCQAGANVRLARVRILFQQIQCGQDHSRSADATLRAAAVDERLLYGMQLFFAGDTFDSLNLRAFNLSDWYQAAIHDLAVDEYRAGAAFAFAATFFGAR